MYVWIRAWVYIGPWDRSGIDSTSHIHTYVPIHTTALHHVVAGCVPPGSPVGFTSTSIKIDYVLIPDLTISSGPFWHMFTAIQPLASTCSSSTPAQAQILAHQRLFTSTRDVPQRNLLLILDDMYHDP